MTKALESALDELLLACAAFSDAEITALLLACATSSDAETKALAERASSSYAMIKALAERVQAERKPRGRGQPKAVLPSLAEATLPGSAEAFLAWHALPAELDENKAVWSDTEVCRTIAALHGVSRNTVKPLVKAIHARLTPPKPLPFSSAEQLVDAQKSVKK